jgi:hypothetical protein
MRAIFLTLSVLHLPIPGKVSLAIFFKIYDKDALIVPDIFISFAHVDNIPFCEAENCWITNFVNHLRTEVDRRTGRAEHNQLWMDFRLNGNDAINP